MTAFDQALREAYRSVEAWERERYGSARAVERECYRCGAGRGSDTTGAAARNSRPTTPVWECELADTIEVERLRRERRP